MTTAPTQLAPPDRTSRKRYCIRTLALIPLLLCIGMWIRTFSYCETIRHNRDSLWTFSTYRHGVAVIWTNSPPESASYLSLGWSYDRRTWDDSGELYSGVGINWLDFHIFLGPRHPFFVQYVFVPFWFLTGAWSVALWRIWRKTAPAPRGFPMGTLQRTGTTQDSTH